MIRYAASVMLTLTALIGAACAEELVSEPDGYRTDDYRSPVPDTLAGARVLSTAEAAAIWRAKTGVFIDVLPRPPKPANLPAGTVWRDKPRFNIPGSIWLPDTGYGALAPSTESYLRQGLSRASGDNRDVLRTLQRRLVSGRHRRLAARQSADGRSAARTATGGVKSEREMPRGVYSISCWMVRPSANSR
jgi:PQQ-dependent catabolism-associated CXXCW motif protein